MNKTPIWTLVAILLALIATMPLHANDSAVETAAGGIRLSREPNVLMEKERLYISFDLVRVEYEFRNTSSETIERQVAFPTPPYDYFYNDPEGKRGFPDFKAWVDDVPVKIEKEVRAWAKGLDVTEELRSLGIKIETFGDFDPGGSTDQINSLPPEQKKRLMKLGALKVTEMHPDPDNPWPAYLVEIKYHWRQTFPPGKTVKVRHEYEPVRGFQHIQFQSFKKEITDSCIDEKTFREVKRRVDEKQKKDKDANYFLTASWVSYILTTANTWQTPIRDFELLVEAKPGWLPTFCWDGQVERIGETKLRARKTDFIPRDELRVYFLGNF